MAGPLARFVALLVRNNIPEGMCPVECVAGRERRSGAENALRALLLFADRVFASADLTTALHPPPQRAVRRAHIETFGRRVPTSTLAVEAPAEQDGENTEALLSKALRCRRWDGAIDADNLACVSRAHDVDTLEHYLGTQTLGNLCIVEVCSGRDDELRSEVCRAAIFFSNNENIWWVDSRHSAGNITMPALKAPWLSNAVVTIFADAHRHGFLQSRWPWTKAPCCGWTSGWVSRVANALCLRRAAPRRTRPFALPLALL